MVTELNNYFEQIRIVFFQVETIGGYSFESLSKVNGSNLYNPTTVYDCLKSLEKELLSRDPNSPDRKIIVERVILEIEKLSNDIKPLEAQLDFSDTERTAYDYLAKVNKTLLSLKEDLREVCQKFGLDIPDLTIANPSKSFPDYFSNKEIPELCKKVFNCSDKPSPKIYAIMFSLLDQKGLLWIPARSRIFLYRAWYKYINKSESQCGNFSPINRHFSQVKGGQAFSDENDIDYKNFKKSFEQALKDISITA